MTEKRFKSVIDEDIMSIMPYLVSDNEEECFYNLQDCVDLLNEFERKCYKLEKENENLESNVRFFKNQFDKLKEKYGD